MSLGYLCVMWVVPGQKLSHTFLMVDLTSGSNTRLMMIFLASSLPITLLKCLRNSATRHSKISLTSLQIASNSGLLFWRKPFELPPPAFGAVRHFNYSQLVPPHCICHFNVVCKPRFLDWLVKHLSPDLFPTLKKSTEISLQFPR